MRFVAKMLFFTIEREIGQRSLTHAQYESASHAASMEGEDGRSCSARRLSVLRGHLVPGGSAVAAVQCAGTGDHSAPVSGSKDERQRAFPRKR